MNREVPFDTLTFDCYGTLIDWEAGIKEAFRLEAARRGLPVDVDRALRAYAELEPEVERGAFRPYREVLRETARRVSLRLGWPGSEGEDRFLEDRLPSWPPFPDTNPALERLRRRYRLGILSNIDDDLLARTLRQLAVPFDWTVTAKKVRSYKPAPAHFEEAIRRAGGPRRLLHVCGSLFYDVTPAHRLGLTVVWVNRTGGAVPESGPRPGRVVGNLLDLADALGV